MSDTTTKLTDLGVGDRVQHSNLRYIGIVEEIVNNRIRVLWTSTGLTDDRSTEQLGSLTILGKKKYKPKDFNVGDIVGHKQDPCTAEVLKVDRDGSYPRLEVKWHNTCIHGCSGQTTHHAPAELRMLKSVLGRPVKELKKEKPIEVPKKEEDPKPKEELATNVVKRSCSDCRYFVEHKGGELHECYFKWPSSKESVDEWKKVTKTPTKGSIRLSTRARVEQAFKDHNNDGLCEKWSPQMNPVRRLFLSVLRLGR